MKKASAFIFLIIISAGFCFGQNKATNTNLAQLRKETNRLDSLCDKLEKKIVFPLFWRAKLKYSSSTKKYVRHKVKIRYINGMRYKVDVYRYENNQSIRIVSVNDKEAKVRWGRAGAGGGREKIRMLRLNDSTLVSTYNKEEK